MNDAPAALATEEPLSTDALREAIANAPLIIYDTETSGLPLWNDPSGDPRQPHIVEIAALLVRPTGEVLDSYHALVKPEGWVISDEVAQIHGITQDIALAGGIPEAAAFEGFIAMHRRAVKRVGFNESFDARILRIAFKRFRSDVQADEWKGGQSECAMRLAKPVCKIPATAKMGSRYGAWKSPNLTEAMREVCGLEHPGAHGARADVIGTAEVYFKIKGVTPPAPFAFPG